MPISAPEVLVEEIIQAGFKDIIANSATYLPLVFANFPAQYQTDAANYINGQNFEVNTAFGYAYDPSQLPVFNIVLSGEEEGTAQSKQMYLGGIVEAADNDPNTEDEEQYGSMWHGAVSVIVRTQVARQTIILYALVKWLMLKNRVALEAAGIMATKYSGTDLIYNPEKQPTFVFSRTFKMDCLVMNTYDVDISDDPNIAGVISKLGDQVRILSEEDFGN